MIDLEQEIRGIYARCAAPLRHHLYLLTGNRADADDLLQEAFIAYLRYRESGREVHQPFAFLCTTATRLVFKTFNRRYRRMRLRQKIPQRDLSEQTTSMLRAYDLLEAIWARLDDRDRLVAKMFILEEMTGVEIAQYSGIPRSTVQRKVARIRSLAAEAQSKPPDPGGAGRGSAGQTRRDERGKP